MTTATKRQTKAQKWGRKPQRKAFKQAQTRQLMADLERLSNEIVTDPERLAEFVKLWQGGFYDYSFHNTLLILFQRHNASLCAGFRQWQDKHNRHVLSGERGIAILAPIFRKYTVKSEDGEETEEREEFAHLFTTAYVWDISQTDGEDVVLGGEQYVNGKSSITLDAFIKLYPEYETSVDGKSLTNGSTDGKRIALTLGKTERMIATFAHELGHIEAGHTNGSKRVKELDRPQRELEAEAISYLVCCYLGIKNDKSKHYIGNWKGTPEKLGKSGKVILSSAYRIIKRIRSAS